jgi:DNA-binding PadR family transcriptional regulator
MKGLGTAQLKVLEAVAGGTAHGFDVIDQTGLASGSVYPALSKLESAGFLRSRWEDAPIARREKRPPRRYYEITPAGRKALEEALEEARGIARSLARAVKALR